jgi:two-component system sensor histidine kinase AtoS
LARDTTPTNPIARFFKSDPHRELFHTLADTLDSAVLVLSGTEPRLITCNHQFLLMTGFARKDLDSLSPSDLFTEAEGQTALEKILQPWDTPECHLQEVPIRTRSGDLLWVDVQAFSVTPTHDAVLVLAKPSQERFSIEAHERAQAERLNLLMEISDLAIESGASTLSLVLERINAMLSASHAGMYQVAPSAPEYTLVGNLPPEFPERVEDSVIGTLPSHSRWSIGQRPEHELERAARAAEIRHLRTTRIGDESAWIGLLVICWQDELVDEDEIETIMQVAANICHAALHVGLLRETSDERRAILNHLEEQIEHLYEGISDTLITVDSEMKVLKANSALARLLGFSPEEVIGRPIQDILVGPEDVSVTLLDALGHRREAERTKLTLHHRQGNPLPTHLRAVPLETPEGTQLLLVLKDQSEQQAIEDQTEILAQRALLGEVTAIFAHEVRNPINNISTGVQLIASRLGSDHPQYEALDRIRTECTRLDQLMSDVLFFARPLELKMEEVDLAEMMERILARWAPRFQQSNVRCQNLFEKGIPHASVDPRTFERVIVNLISNALEAMTEGGTISVSINMMKDREKDQLELKVADTGPGIPADKIERIYDPFFTTKKDGTGLGLAISRRIMTAHRGTIQVESFPDAGTVFTIHLPAKE